MPGGREDLLERLPEAERAVAGGQFGRDGQAARLEVDQQFAPTLRALAHSDLGLSGIPCLGPYDAAEGAIVCRPATSLRSGTSCWTSPWPDLPPGPPWPTGACWTGSRRHSP